MRVCVLSVRMRVCAFLQYESRESHKHTRKVASRERTHSPLSFPHIPVSHGIHELEQGMHHRASGLKGQGVEEHLCVRMCAYVCVFLTCRGGRR
jgi:hypothetical protein